MMKRVLVVLGLLLGSLAPSFEAAAEQIIIRIGASLPLSGRLAYVGQDIQRGLELGLADFSNAQLGFQMVLEDNQHDSKLAATTARKLLDRDHVDVIISLWDMSDVVAPLAERAKTPHLAIRWNPHIAEKYSYTLTVESTYRSYVDSLVRLLKFLKVRSVGLLTEEAQGWVLASDYLKQIAAGAGLEVVGDERYLNQDPDLRTVVLKLLGKRPELVVLLSNPPNTETLIQRIREAAPAQRFTGYFEYMESPSLVEGVPFAAQFAAAPWFEEKFLAKFGTPLKARAPQAYDIVKLLTAVQGASSKKLTGAEIMRGLSLIHNLPGASGTLNVNATRNIESECVWKIAREGKFRIMPEGR